MNNNIQFLDLFKPEAVEIRIRGDGKVAWVNVDGQCVFRCQNPKVLEVVDERKYPINRNVSDPEYQPTQEQYFDTM
jgi:hypothetical protein